MCFVSDCSENSITRKEITLKSKHHWRKWISCGDRNLNKAITIGLRPSPYYFCLWNSLLFANFVALIGMRDTSILFLHNCFDFRAIEIFFKYNSKNEFVWQYIIIGSKSHFSFVSPWYPILIQSQLPRSMSDIWTLLCRYLNKNNHFLNFFFEKIMMICSPRLFLRPHPIPQLVMPVKYVLPTITCGESWYLTHSYHHCPDTAMALHYRPDTCQCLPARNQRRSWI